MPVTIPDQSLEQSYRLCEQIARRRARNFYFSFLTLPRPRRRAMCAVYAFMRYCDDLADDTTGEEIPGIASPDDRARNLESWRKALWRIGQGETTAHPMMPAFLDTVQRYGIPLQYFEEVINGAEMDLRIRRYSTFQDLYGYCYRVASAVGLTCIKVFGCRSEQALRLGEWCGIAFQLTNILRDIREDAAQDRIYLPLEDLDRFHCTEQDLCAQKLRPSVRPLLEFQAIRAQYYYQQSLPLIDLTEPDSLSSLSAMISIYHRLLREIGRQGCDVFSQRISIPTAQKLAIAARCWMAPSATVRREVGRGFE